MPNAGSQSSLTENNTINSIASQNGGVPYNNSAPLEISPSSQRRRWRLSAASAPRATPNSDEMTNAEPIRLKVAGRRSDNKSQTGA